MPADNPTTKPNGSDASDQQTRQQLRTKAFRIALEMVAVFGIPAATALLVGRWLQDPSRQPEWVTYALLSAAFIVSWVIVFYRVRSIAREFDNNQQTQEVARDNSQSNAVEESTADDSS
jgi:uncharacterized membrane protein YcjF (UPF0283 family)